MIAVDIPMPATCVECPMSYWKQGGRLEGMLMCEAMESRWLYEQKKNDGTAVDYIREHDGDLFLVDEFMEVRPDRCPIAGEIIYRLK